MCSSRIWPRKSGVSSDIRCSAEIRCQFIILARKDELTPDYVPDYAWPPDMRIAQDLSISRVRKAGKSGMVQLPDLRG